VWYGENQCGYETEDSTHIRETRDEIMNRPELANVKAVKDGEVFVICYKIGASPQYPIGMAYMAKWFNPDLFEDLDPQAMHEEYLERFQGVSYQGVYVYPLLDES
jgi:iron complex transport system substrate-binding protein